MEKKCLYVRRQRAKTEGGEESARWVSKSVRKLKILTIIVANVPDTTIQFR